LLVGPSPADAKARYGALRISANVAGATVKVGRRTYTPPKTIWLRIGYRYRLTISAPGYQSQKRAVVLEKRRDQLKITLQPERGALRLVAVNSAGIGAVVSVDGTVSGNVPTTLELAPGRHLVVVKKAGFRAWKKWFTVSAKQRDTVAITLLPSAGAVEVVTRPVGATVAIDGNVRGRSPLTLKDVAAGRHLVELRAKGYARAIRIVEIKAGQRHKVDVTLVSASKTGSLKVLTNPPNVDVYVDGEFRGKSPLALSSIAAGTHLVTAKWPGFENQEKSVVVDEGRVLALQLEMKKVVAAASQPKRVARGGHLLVASSHRGAAVLLDGALIGHTPLAEPNLAPKTYRVRVHAPGYEPYEQVVLIRVGRATRLMAQLQRASHGVTQTTASGSVSTHAPTAATGSRSAVDIRGLSSFGAQLVPRGYFVGDIGLGFPQFISARVTTGLWERGHLAVDVGVDLRSNGAMTEGGLRARMRIYQGSPVAVAVFAALGGGGGANSRNTFYGNVGVTATLMFKGLLNVSATIYGNFYTDRLCPEAPESGEADACIFPPADLDLDDVRGRFGGARAILQASAELSLWRRLGLFFMVEGAPFQPQRWAFTNRFIGLMPGDDPRFYAQAGISLKF
jgi:hypothetical protein